MYKFNLNIHTHIHITANILYALSNTLHYTFKTGIRSFNFLRRFTLLLIHIAWELCVANTYTNTHKLEHV